MTISTKEGLTTLKNYWGYHSFYNLSEDEKEKLKTMDKPRICRRCCKLYEDKHKREIHNCICPEC